MTEPPRSLSRSETHDLSMIIRDRAKVLKAHVEQRGAELLADFDLKLARQFAFDESMWQKVGEAAGEIVIEAQTKLAGKCKEFGIPSQYAPALDITWVGRGNAAVEAYRSSLRRMARSSIDAMAKRAMTRIERTSLDLRTQVVGMGMLSADAKLFLESLASVEESMAALEFREVEIAVEKQQVAYRRGEY